MVSGRRVREVGQLLKGDAGGNRSSVLLETLGKVSQISPRKVMGAEGRDSSIKLLPYWLAHRKPDL